MCYVETLVCRYSNSLKYFSPSVTPAFFSIIVGLTALKNFELNFLWKVISVDAPIILAGIVVVSIKYVGGSNVEVATQDANRREFGS